jgi:hypothetical protein
MNAAVKAHEGLPEVDSVLPNGESASAHEDSELGPDV